VGAEKESRLLSLLKNTKTALSFDRAGVKKP
jgi:hypothetical protein